jgi:phosphatidylethanolamine-binding protein (PEBP) family uncharacterized protein
MRLSRSALASIVVCALLSGCAGSSARSPGSAANLDTESDTTSNAAAGGPPGAHLVISSDAFQAGPELASGEHALPARYTCDGSNFPPAVRWTGVPPGTTELILIVMDLSAPGSKRLFDWAVAGLQPTLVGLPAGVRPLTGAVVGRNSFGRNGYSVCPPRGHVNDYIVLLFAVRHRLSLRSGFDPNAVYETAGDRHLGEAQSGFVYLRR